MPGIEVTAASQVIRPLPALARDLGLKLGEAQTDWCRAKPDIRLVWRDLDRRVCASGRKRGTDMAHLRMAAAGRDRGDDRPTAMAGIFLAEILKVLKLTPIELAAIIEDIEMILAGRKLDRMADRVFIRCEGLCVGRIEEQPARLAPARASKAIDRTGRVVRIGRTPGTARPVSAG